MSGFAGFVSHDDRPAKIKTVHQMIDAIKTRGPDGFGFYSDSSCALGHAHSFSTPESETEKQPYTDTASGITITADVRLDNRDELIQTLNLNSLPKNSIGDGQLILEAYLRWGEDCPKHLLGDFSFTIWDPRHQILFGARDHFGVKPFVYYHDQKLFAFASQPGAVLACKGVPKKLNEERIADFLVPWLSGIDHTSTFFCDLNRLPPAHTITIKSGELSISRYWTLKAPAELILNSDEDYASAFREVFTTAIDRRLRGGDRVGAMLSGGLDSSSIVAVARNLRSTRGESPLKTFTAVLPEDEPNIETACARAVMKQGHITPEIIDKNEYLQGTKSYLDQAIHCDNPFDFQMDIPSAIYSRATKIGVRAVMDGIEGDMVTSISTRYPLYLIKNGHYLTLVKEFLGWYQQLYDIQLLFNNQNSKTYLQLKSLHNAIRHLLDCSIPAILPNNLWKYARKRRKRLKIQQHLDQTHIHPAFAEQVNLSKRLSKIYDIGLPKIEPANINERQLLVLNWPSLTAALENYDSAAARYGVEPLHPFLDLDLVQFCLSLPWHLKTRNGWQKWILRKAIGPILPAQVKNRVDRMHLGGRFAEAAFLKEVERNPAEHQWDESSHIHKYILNPNPPNSFERSPEVFLSYWLKNWQ